MSAKPLRVLNLGAGVQSTAVYLLMVDGEIEPASVAYFADVQEEPAAVYKHLEWLKSLEGPQIRTVSAGKLGDDLIAGQDTTRHRFASIPAYTSGGGMTRRQCSSEYKIDPIDRAIRREVLGLKPRQRWPKSVELTQIFGISFDERSRASRIFERYDFNQGPRRCEFPLLDRKWTRRDCLEYLADRVPHEVPRSACVFCPFHSDLEWARIRDNDPDGWARAVEIDKALRTDTARAGQGLSEKLYLHAARIPLGLVQLKPDVQPAFNFGDECEGVCGL